jgi:hypothetical protein
MTVARKCTEDQLVQAPMHYGDQVLSWLIYTPDSKVDAHHYNLYVVSDDT